jgi:Tfp pilus assembly protein PilP
MYARGIDMSWILRQSELVQRLIKTPVRCKNLTQLRNLGKGCYEAQKAKEPAQYQTVYNSMTNSQKSVFWTAYNQRKRELMEGIPLSTTAKALVKRVTRSKKHELPRLKANLVRLQKGQIRVRDPPSDQEWEVVWYYFSQRDHR